MMDSPQIIEMLHDLRREELARISRHRIDALDQRQREGVRRTVASALVRLAITLDHDAGARHVLAR
jgi:hypothetical protein